MVTKTNADDDNDNDNDDRDNNDDIKTKQNIKTVLLTTPHPKIKKEKKT